MRDDLRVGDLLRARYTFAHQVDKLSDTWIRVGWGDYIVVLGFVDLRARNDYDRRGVFILTPEGTLTVNYYSLCDDTLFPDEWED